MRLFKLEHNVPMCSVAKFRWLVEISTGPESAERSFEKFNISSCLYDKTMKLDFPGSERRFSPPQTGMEQKLQVN